MHHLMVKTQDSQPKSQNQTICLCFLSMGPNLRKCAMYWFVLRYYGSIVISFIATWFNLGDVLSRLLMYRMSSLIIINHCQYALITNIVIVEVMITRLGGLHAIRVPTPLCLTNQNHVVLISKYSTQIVHGRLPMSIGCSSLISSIMVNLH